MKPIHLTVYALLLSLISVVPLTSHADRDKRDYRERHERPSSSHQDRRFEYQDRRYEHNRNYPREGHTVRVLPEKRRPIHFHNHDYYYFGGVWYQPSGLDFIVIRPPLGIIVPILPSFYTTIWVGDIPYYYANGVYYQWRTDLSGYEVVDLPVPEEKQSEMTYMADKLFIYPKKGQSKQQQADDRYACHREGVEKSGYDPSQPPPSGSADQLSRQREDYQRTMRSCLEAKDYSVR